MDGKNQLFDLNREKQELDLFLSSITGEEVTPAVAKGAKVETFISGALSSSADIKPKTEIAADYINTDKWGKTPWAIDKTSSKDDQNNINKNWTKTSKSLDEIQMLDNTIKTERPASSYLSQFHEKSVRQSDDFISNEKTSAFVPEDGGGRKVTWIALIIVFFIISFIVAGFSLFYPEKKTQALQWIVSSIPYADKVITVDKDQKNPDTGEIQFIDVRQRFIRNTSLGRNIKVIEGIVKNNTATNISKVKLIGELYDSEGSLFLTSKTSLAGNVLTDDKLEILDENKIFSALSIAPASNLSEAKIPPGGQVPFMIVFTRESDKVYRLVIIPTSE